MTILHEMRGPKVNNGRIATLIPEAALAFIPKENLQDEQTREDLATVRRCRRQSFGAFFALFSAKCRFFDTDDVKNLRRGRMRIRGCEVKMRRMS
jgi:hypothetical protein